MLDSQDAATAAALSQLGIKPASTSVAVGGFSTGSPSAGKLALGDRIVAVNGTAVSTPDQLTAQIGRVKPGQAVRITYQRGGGPRQTVSITTAAAPGDARRPIIGITPTRKSVYPVTVKIGLKDVGGPSAGLMFAIGIVDLLTPGDLAGGRTIAGTGEITQNGSVGAIGGIQQKLLGARRSGATVFLVPADNCPEASQATPKGLRLVKVGTLADALGSLEALRANPSARLSSC
jgi:PDZ domain-containing protein